MENHYFAYFKKIAFVFSLLTWLFSITGFAQTVLSTDYFKISINNKGFITSMKNITVKPGQELSATGKPSPVLCLYNSRKNVYYEPQTAGYSGGTKVLTLKYDNGSVAMVKIESRKNILNSLYNLLPIVPKSMIYNGDLIIRRSRIYLVM